MNLTLQPLPGTFTVCQIADWHAIDLTAPFVFTASTDEERSLLCPTALVPPNTLARQDGWRGLRVTGELDFSLIGILSSLTGILAANAIPVFAVSTFRTDYLFLNEADFSRALKVFSQKGYRILPSCGE